MWDQAGHVVVTGSLGRVGQAVCDDLEQQGIAWRGIDLAATPRFTPSGSFAHVRYDLRDYGAAVAALRGARAVVHAAAIAFPSFEADQKTYVDNVTSSYNVFSAASLLGIARVVWLSSEEVYGHPFGTNVPDCVPIAECHPARIGNSYALAKLGGEQAAAFFAQAGTTCFIGIRSTVVQGPADYAGYPALLDCPQARMWSLWSYVDARDLARACRLALDADCAGAHMINIAAADTVIDIPSRDLAARYLPGVAQRWRADAPRFASFCDTQAAERLIGFVPALSWRDQPAAQPAAQPCTGRPHG